MGTISKFGWNDRCTKRGPVPGQTVGDAIEVLSDPERHNHKTRRWAKSKLRKQAKFIRKHIPKDERTTIHKDILVQASFL